MENKRFLTAQDVMEMLGVSLSYSYKLIRRLNAELEADGFVTSLQRGMIAPLLLRTSVAWASQLTRFATTAKTFTII